MIVARTITVLAGATTGQLQGLDSGLLRELADSEPKRMPYLVAVRVVLPAAQPVWRLDATHSGGSLVGSWWNIATSNAATIILPPFAPAAVPLQSDWQQAHIYPGIPLTDGGDGCRNDWIINTTLQFTSPLGAASLYTVHVLLNIVMHNQLRS